MIQLDFSELPRSCKKCNYDGDKSDQAHKEYCRYFQKIVKSLDWFPRNKLERQRDLEEAWRGFHTEEYLCDKAIHFMVIIACEYDQLVESAINLGKPHSLIKFESFAYNFLSRQVRQCYIGTKLWAEIRHRIAIDS